MNKLEDRIRTSLHSAAAHLPGEAQPVTTLAKPARARRVPGPLVAVGSLVAVMLVVGGSLLLVSRSDVDELVTASGVGSERFPVPRYVPSDAELVYGNYGVPDPANPAAVGAVVARVTDEGFEDAVSVTVFDTSQLPVGFGESVDDEVGEVAWENGQRAIRVAAAYDMDGAILTSVAAAVESVDVQPFGASALAFGDLPAGFSVLALPHLLPDVATPIVSIQGPPTQGVFTFYHVDIDITSEALAYRAGLMGSGELVQVRGREGYRSSNENGTALSWSEGPGLTVSVFGNYPYAELLAIAEGLELVTEAEWQAEYQLDDQQLPTTTVTFVTPTDVPTVDTDGDGPDAPTTTASRGDG